MPNVSDKRNIQFNDKRLKMIGASWVEPQEAITLWEDFTMDVLADSPYVTVTQSGTAVTPAAVTAPGRCCDRCRGIHLQLARDCTDRLEVRRDSERDR